MATKVGRNMSDIEKYLKSQAKQLCEFASNELFQTINYFLNQYYSEFTPTSYQRTEDFLRSAFKTTVKQVGNSFVAEVGIDYDSLDNYKDATGYEVVKWSNMGLHGGMDVGTDTNVWDDALDITIRNGQLLKDCIDFLKGKGINVVA